MKALRVILLVILSIVLIMQSACISTPDGNENKDKKDNTKDEKEENNLIDDNPYIDCEPPSFGDYDWGVYIKTLNMEEYLVEKERRRFSSDEWYPWEQFSCLGEFDEAYWYEERADLCAYQYLYTDPADPSVQFVYDVNIAKKLSYGPDQSIRRYTQWRYGNTYPYSYEYSSDDFPTGNFMKPDLPKKNAVYYPNDCVRIEYSHNYKIFMISILHDGWLIDIIKDGTYNDDGSYTPGYIDSDKENEMIRRLLNADTYMEAIEELMDPANGGYVSG